MNTCMCCTRREIKPTFSFYCRWCYNYLQHKYSLNIADYIMYFQIMCNKIVPVGDCKSSSFNAIHNHFQHNLHVTDKPLSELLEVLLFLKATAYSWKR